jgi:phage terminase large subunit
VIELTFEASSDKQKQAAAAWFDDTTTEIIYGGAKGGGKSYLGAALIFSHALTYPGTRYFIARKQLIDLRIHTIPTIDKVFKGWGIKLEEFGKFNGQDHCYYFKNGSAVLLIDAKEEPSDPLFERFGSMEMTQGWIEEAGEFEKNAKINLTVSLGRCMNDKYGLKRKLLMTCNPKKNFLYEDYYLPWRDGKLNPKVKFIQAFAHENTKNESGYVDNLNENLIGIERERLLDGIWEYAEDSDQLMTFDKIMDIFSNTHVPGGRKSITSDIARLGGDKIPWCEWDGNRGRLGYWEKQELNITAQKLEERRYNLGIGTSDVLIDEDGMGQGIVDFLKFKGFANGSSALPATNGPKDDKGNPIPENYKNLKSQCYYRLAKKVNENNIYLQCENEQIKKWLIQELQQVRQEKVDTDGKKGVMPKDKVKEKIGRSPDFSDTIMMHELFDLKPKKVFVWV